MRLFIAVKLPNAVAERASTLLPEDLPALRRVQPELLHLTLAFLGSTPDARLSDVVAAARAAAAQTTEFEVVLSAIGRFPESGRPNVIWIRAEEGAGGLIDLGARVRAALRDRRIAFDDKPFRPHVTLARVRPATTDAEAGAIATALRAMSVPALRFRADALHVIESTLSPRGPRYASLEVVRLGRVRAGGPERSSGGEAGDERRTSRGRR